jgi:hypothetical protein
MRPSWTEESPIEQADLLSLVWVTIVAGSLPRNKLTLGRLRRIFTFMILASANFCCCPNAFQLVERDASEFMT